MTVNIRDIAELAGVSEASVSRALNDRPGVSDATRERIRAVAERMGYRPDARARALVTGEVPLLGLVVPDITNPFFPAVARGAEEEAHEHGYSLLLLNTNWRRDRLLQAFEILSTRRVAGLMVSAPIPDALFAQVPGRTDFDGRVVCVSVDRPTGTRFDMIGVDDDAGGAAVSTHLLARGCRRIAFLSGPVEETSARQRLAGLRRALDKAGEGERLRYVSHGEWTVRSGEAQTAQILDEGGRPDAVFAANDLVAIGAWRALRERGLRAGEDLALVGYDDIDAVRWPEVAITSVAQPKAEVGQGAVRLLLASLEAGAQGANVRLAPTLEVRQSSAHFRAGR